MLNGRIGEAIIERVFERFVKILDEYEAISVIESDIRNAEKSVLIFSPLSMLNYLLLGRFLMRSRML